MFFQQILTLQMYAIFHVEPAMKSHHLPPFYREGRGEAQNKKTSRSAKKGFQVSVMFLQSWAWKSSWKSSLCLMWIHLCVKGSRNDKRGSCGGLEFRNEASKNLWPKEFQNRAKTQFTGAFFHQSHFSSVVVKMPVQAQAEMAEPVQARVHPPPTKTETLGAEPSHPRFNRPSGWFWCTFEFGRLCLHYHIVGEAGHLECSKWSWVQCKLHLPFFVTFIKRKN